ncbi:hypothetical protein [Sphingomonas sp. S2-65]|uniref:hypothetical protein n=1 Tax=Sphingomonas sp. S2-65 TaxID=2903960 RepID=UPI001F3A8091|nr:hypothetical protein [Sphingomonas sp. S2-65]UYY57992.1 hypothetical protein LZ586_15210 [Sphingomonas sp. S2-65]
MLDRDISPVPSAAERLTDLRLAVDVWLTRHEAQVRDLGKPEDVSCFLGGRRFAGYECFDCDFEGAGGKRHALTVSVCFENQLASGDAEVVDAVSAITLIAMLLERVKIRPILRAT